MSKLCKSFERYWDVEARQRKLNPHEPTFFDGELSNKQSLRVAIVFSVLAIAILTFWSIVVML